MYALSKLPLSLICQYLGLSRSSIRYRVNGYSPRFAYIPPYSSPYLTIVNIPVSRIITTQLSIYLDMTSSLKTGDAGSRPPSIDINHGYKSPLTIDRQWLDYLNQTIQVIMATSFYFASC